MPRGFEERTCFGSATKDLRNSAVVGDFTMFLDRVRGFYLRDTQPLAALQVWQEYRENEQMLDRICDHLQVLPK
jgi:hypothetical protein